MARVAIHPGEILADELKAIGVSVWQLAETLELPHSQMSELLDGTRNITTDTATRLSDYFGTTADFWMNLQSGYERDLALQLAF